MRTCHLLNASFGAAGVILSSIVAISAAETGPRPVRVLLITGGCCHDYAHQKDILKKGLEERANIVIDQVHTADGSTRPP